MMKALSVFGAFSAGFLTLYGLWRARRMKKPQDYFTEIHRIGMLARGEGAEADKLPLEAGERARLLDERLVLLKLELIADFCQGRFKSELMLLNLFTSIADSRREIASLRTRSGVPPTDAERHPGYSTATLELLHHAS